MASSPAPDPQVGKRDMRTYSIRIMLTCASLSPNYGGPAFSVSQLASALAGAGAEVGLWAADQTAVSTPSVPPKSSIRCLIGTEVEALNQFGRADVLHDNGMWLGHNHRLANLARAGSIPRIVSTRGMLEPWALNHKQWKKAFAWRLYQRRDLARAACHHATSNREAENLRIRNLGAPICMIQNGVEIPNLANCAWPSRDQRDQGKLKCALFLGRLYPVKGLPLLIEAWARLRPKDWHLKIAGPDQAGCKEDLEGLVAATGLQDTISFLGPLGTEGKRAAFLESNLFILPSHSESFGMAIAEALAHGLPVLTTTATPWPTLVAHDCGWYVEPTIEGLVAGLRDATSCDPDTLSAMGARGRAFVAAEFRWEVIARKFLQVYETLCMREPRRVKSEACGT
jgi:glycosyltransferase involved in cell wall biosynthesis